MPASGWRVVVARAIPLFLAAAVYYPITANFFSADDFVHLYRAVNWPLARFLVQPHGGHVLVVRNLLYAVFLAVFGPDPFRFFWIVLLTHLLNVWLFFEVVRSFTRSARLACLGATLWGMAPVLVDSLGWYAVYGQVLVGTILLAVLLHAARIAGRGGRVSGVILAAWYVVLLAGTTCFGNGIGIAIAFSAVMLLLLPPGRNRTAVVATLATLSVVAPALWIADHWVAEHVFGSPPELALFVGLVPDWRPNGAVLLGLLAYGVMSVHLGFLVPNIQHPHVPEWAIVALYVAGIVAVAVRGPSPLRRSLVACLVLAAAGYAVIAIGRATVFMVSTPTTPMTIAARPRYHYAGTIPLTIGSCLIAARVFGGVRAGSLMKDVAVATVVALLAATYTHAHWRIEHWDDARRETSQVLRVIRWNAAAQPPPGPVIVDNRPFAHAGFQPPTEFPGWAGIFVIFFPANAIDGRPVYFVDERPEVLNAARGGRRSATLLIPRR